jgi:hypothetical protein
MRITRINNTLKTPNFYGNEQKPKTKGELLRKFMDSLSYDWLHRCNEGESDTLIDYLRSLEGHCPQTLNSLDMKKPEDVKFLLDFVARRMTKKNMREIEVCDPDESCEFEINVNDKEKIVVKFDQYYTTKARGWMKDYYGKICITLEVANQRISHRIALQYDNKYGFYKKNVEYFINCISENLWDSKKGGKKRLLKIMEPDLTNGDEFRISRPRKVNNF